LGSSRRGWHTILTGGRGKGRLIRGLLNKKKKGRIPPLKSKTSAAGPPQSFNFTGGDLLGSEELVEGGVRNGLDDRFRAARC